LQVPLPHRVLEHRARALVALLALLLTALGLAACGDDGGNGGSGSSADAETLLTRTFTGAHRMSSGTVDLRLRIDAQGGDSSLNGPIELNVTGPFQSGEGDDDLPRFDLALEAGAQGQHIEAGLVSTSDRLFVRVGDTAYEVPGLIVSQLKEQFRKARRQASGGSLLDLGDIDPMSWLNDPEVVGSETVGGVETDHITAQVDVAALLDDIEELLPKLREQIPSGVGGPEIPESIPEDTRRQIEDAIKDATVDVWTGQDDRTLRKLTLRVTVEPPEDSDAPDSLDVDFSVAFADLNEPQTIEAPTSTRPFSELLTQLQGLLGGSGLGGGGAASPNIDEYTECLQEAGGDAAKAQKCADLLNP
jgi:hypothetical protein